MCSSRAISATCSAALAADPPEQALQLAVPTARVPSNPSLREYSTFDHTPHGHQRDYGHRDRAWRCASMTYGFAGMIRVLTRGWPLVVDALAGQALAGADRGRRG